jgi:hypothetical protein
MHTVLCCVKVCLGRPVLACSGNKLTRRAAPLRTVLRACLSGSGKMEADRTVWGGCVRDNSDEWVCDHAR